MKIDLIGNTGLIEEVHEAVAAQRGPGVDTGGADSPASREEAVSSLQPNAAYSRLGRYVP